MKAVACACLAGVMTVVLCTAVLAQESKSASLVAELDAALSTAKLDNIAARDPANPDVFFAALFFKGAQCLVVSGKYSAPTLLKETLDSKNYRDVYMDLNTASVAGSKVLIEDSACDGLKPTRTENRYDSYEAAAKRTEFNGEWKAQKMSEEDYNKAFQEADALYSRILAALTAQAKKTS